MSPTEPPTGRVQQLECHHQELSRQARELMHLHPNAHAGCYFDTATTGRPVFVKTAGRRRRPQQDPARFFFFVLSRFKIFGLPVAPC